MKDKIKRKIEKGHWKLVYSLASFTTLYFIQFAVFGAGFITNFTIELVCFILMLLLLMYVCTCIDDIYAGILEYIEIDEDMEEDKDED